jgi:hypothetical protein
MRMTDRETTNRALVRYLLLPTIFLTVALTGGVRVDAATRALLFRPPPLITLLCAALLMLLFVRGRLLELRAWFAAALPARANVAHALTLLALFFASAQAFNAVLPEAGLMRWLFAFFFLWTLWQQQFAAFDARRLLRSLAALFGTAFALKHLLLASLYAPDGGWLKRLAGALVEGFTQGTLGAAESFAPATGYLAFFTLALYVVGLILLPVAPAAEAERLDTRMDGVAAEQLAPARQKRLPAETRAEAATFEGEIVSGGSEQTGDE